MPGKLPKIRKVAAIVTFAAALAAFCLRNPLAATIAKLQVDTALAFFASWSLPLLGYLLVLLALTLAFGRVFCAFICPLGTLQDLIEALWFAFTKKRPTAPQNLPGLRYAICAISFGCLAAGSCAAFWLLGPYPTFGRIAVCASAAALIPLAILIALVIWKRRFFCTNICPVGTALGQVARLSPLAFQFSDACVHCGRCEQSCPTGALSHQKQTADNERCVRCFACLEACRPAALSLEFTRPKPLPTDQTRRAILVNGSIVAAGLAAGAVAGRLAIRFSKPGGTTSPDGFTTEAHATVLPPGAGSLKRFDAICTACHLCVAICPQRIIKPDPARGYRVFLDLDRAPCDFNCNACTQVCPTGAIPHLSLVQKQRTPIAKATYNPATCKVTQDLVNCGKCALACPTHAITLRKTRTGMEIPVLNNDLCIGCAACQTACPATPKAMTV